MFEIMEICSNIFSLQDAPISRPFSVSEFASKVRTYYVLNDFFSADRSYTTKYFWKKLVAHIFTLLLAYFAFKLANYSRHKESLKNIWKRSNSCFRRKIPSISISSDSWKSHCALNNGPVWTQKAPKDVSYKFL